MRGAVLACLLAACGYSPTAATTTTGDGPGGDDDAPAEGPPPACVKNTKSCSGRALQTCNEDGTGFTATETCPLTCDVDHCTQASNLDAAKQLACTGAGAPSYTASTNAGIKSNLDLACDGCTTIPATQRIELGAIDLAYYCLSHLEIPAGASFGTTDGTDAAIVFFVDGDVVINGQLDIDGGSPTRATGAFDGGGSAAANGGQGAPGTGSCFGSGAQATAFDSGLGANVGGGGGGGGGFNAGAPGGQGRDTHGVTANGGNGGGSTGCSTPELIPLIGGSGGGGGGDGACNGNNSNSCGQQGGGGGGGVQIVATGTITIGAQGTIKATGGDGGGNGNDTGDAPGGGGGGGAGGSILLEAPTLSLAGTLDVNGGDGGSTANHAGGTGATPLAAPGSGTNFTVNGQGGSGGGGGLGRVRLNAKIGATCAVAAGCTTGGLRPVP